MVKIIKEFITNMKAYFSRENRVPLANSFDDWTLWEKMWIGVSTVAILAASLMTWDPTNLLSSWVALISSITGIWTVVLVAKGKISNYLWGFVNVIFYAWAAYTWKLYGEVMLNAIYFLPMQFVGLYIWTKPEFRKGNNNVKIKFLTWKTRIMWALVSIAAIFTYGTILDSMGGLTPYLDASSTVVSIIAMVLMARLFMEQWILWIIVDVVTVIMWANIVFNEGGMFNMGILVMWVCWLINAVYGMTNWIKMKKLQDAQLN